MMAEFLLCWLELGLFDVAALLYLSWGLRKGKYGEEARRFYYHTQSEDGISEQRALTGGVIWSLLLPPVFFVGIFFMYVRTFKDARKLQRARAASRNDSAAGGR